MIVDEGPRLSNFIGTQGLTLNEKVKGKKSAQVSPNLRKKVLPPLHSSMNGNSVDQIKYQSQKLFKPQSKVELKSSRKQLFAHMRTKSNNFSRQTNSGLRNSLQKTHSQLSIFSSRSGSKKLTQRDPISMQSSCSDSTMADSHQIQSSICNDEHISQTGSIDEVLPSVDTTICQQRFEQQTRIVPTETPCEIMTRRWKKIVETTLPAIDLIDLSDEKDPYGGVKVQFAPEYSQSAYKELMRQEFAIGDYI